MYPRRIPGSDTNLGLAAAFVVALTLFLVFTAPSATGAASKWQEARPELQDAPVLVETGLPAVETPTAGDCEVTVS